MTAPLWTPEEIASATASPVVAMAPVTGISIDTRTLAAGDLFCAIRGDARDGHDFVRAAFQKGAAAALVAQERAAEFAGTGPLVVVDDVLEGLQRLGVAARRRTAARVAAVTGSVGKTGTKEALRLVLAREGGTHASAASYNNHWGVPLTLARMPRESRFGVFEIGMNHAGEIAPLTRMVRPHVAAITTIEPVHIEYFRSILGIADAKGEIFGGLEPGGVAVIGRDSPYFARLQAHALASPAGRVISFGESEGADVRASRIVLKPEGSIVEASVLGAPLAYRVGTPGRHVAMNSLAVLASVVGLGADFGLAALALADLKPPVGRGERQVLPVGSGEVVLIDESYNANPASVRAALAVLGTVEPGRRGRRIAVLGDMLELGDQSPALHRDLAEAVEANGVDLVYAAGALMRELFEALPRERRGGHAATSADLRETVLDGIRDGDVVMVKGSNSIRMGLIVQALKDRYAANSPDMPARVGQRG